MYYILDENKQVVSASMDEMATFFKTPENKIVAQFEVNGHQISTVFLGLDHGFGSDTPIVFETMIFGGSNEICERYATYEEAVAGHNALALKMLGGWTPDDDLPYKEEEEPWEE